MAAPEGLAERVVAAGRRCSLTTAVLQEWSRRGTPRQVGYLAEYLEAECRSRDASKRASLLRRCALPQPKTFDGYEWGQISWPEGFGRDELLSLSFLDAHEDLVLMGDVGTGNYELCRSPDYAEEWGGAAGRWPGAALLPSIIHGTQQRPASQDMRSLSAVQSGYPSAAGAGDDAAFSRSSLLRSRLTFA